MAESRKLYLVATPIGNLADLSPRAKETLERVSVIVAEDTREARKLFDLCGVSSQQKEFLSHAAHNLKESVDRCLDRIEARGEGAFVSDRGTAAISDPGAALVEGAWRRGFTVIPIPGPSAVTTALSASGFGADRFVFAGFLPREDKAREELFQLLEKVRWTACFFEAPTRARESITDLRNRFPDAELFIGREMTKTFETYERFAMADLDVERVVEKGEFTMVLRLAPPKEVEGAHEAAIVRAVQGRLAGDKDWAKSMAETVGVSAKELYDRLQSEKRNRN